MVGCNRKCDEIDDRGEATHLKQSATPFLPSFSIYIVVLAKHQENQRHLSPAQAGLVADPSYGPAAPLQRIPSKHPDLKVNYIYTAVITYLGPLQ